MKLSIEEIMQLQYILPVQGDLKTLELVEKIVNKSMIKDSNVKEKDIDFTDHEIDCMQDFIKFLNDQKQLSFKSLSLIRKIMNNKGDSI